MIYKLIGTKENETAEQAIIRCANNLVKAIIAGGYSLNQTSGVSGFEIGFYKHIPQKIFISNILSSWEICGNTTLIIPFAPHYSEVQGMNDLTQDE